MLKLVLLLSLTGQLAASDGAHALDHDVTTTRLDVADVDSTVEISRDRLTATFTGPDVRSVRSTVSISPESGWYYFEGQRLQGVGDYGIGVATRRAHLQQGPGADTQSIGLTSNGKVLVEGKVERLTQTESTEYYGIAVDYTGTSPVVHLLITDRDGHCQVIPGFELSDVFDDLFIVAFGRTDGDRASIKINAGDDLQNTPFHYPAHYEIFNLGYEGAEFLGSGWGTRNRYRGVEAVGQLTEVKFVLDADSGEGITLSDDGLAARYSIDKKMGVRANQGMIGEFRYWECSRLVRKEHFRGDGFGCGLIPEYARINPLPYRPRQPTVTVNSTRGVWQNLDIHVEYDRFNKYYGFAVDYRGDRPIIYVIIDEELVATLTMSDVFTPIYPLLYGNLQNHPKRETGAWVNRANFGGTTFYYDPQSILEDAGIDTTEFVAGWGEANRAEKRDRAIGRWQTLIEKFEMEAGLWIESVHWYASRIMVRLKQIRE